MAATHTLVWQIGCKYGFVTETILAQLVEITKTQWSAVVESGGKPVVSGTIGGESVTFQLPPNFNPANLSELCRVITREIADMTDAQVRTYALREDIASTRVNWGSLEV